MDPSVPKIPPLSLYVHFPWCLKKCPYCDFNSYKIKGSIPEAAYIQALLQDLRGSVTPDLRARPLISIFIGGGTPSLFSGKAIKELLSEIQEILPFSKDIEITLEANPGAVEQSFFAAYQEAGVNRLSIGVQSFSDIHLKRIGRIHSAKEAFQAIELAQKIGFNNFNIDLMYGLVKQTLSEAMADLKSAIETGAPHVSWYQLTLEPQTFFSQFPPILPNENVLCDIQETGEAILQEHKFTHYEISAWGQERFSRHNCNYWTYGDYLGIGAGAHAKVTQYPGGTIMRQERVKHPQDYMSKTKPFIQCTWTVSPETQIFEYFLNRFRLLTPPSCKEFREVTGLPLEAIEPMKQLAIHKLLLEDLPDWIQPTPLGRRFLNDLTSLFLPK
ncbi:MAG TPA: radical SAM family heme chaperone HemW [Gammaproteobacteria bacterium]|nr:radical SAM family heme chaperone HemW [Gammaproteobacteria bacterium]